MRRSHAPPLKPKASAKTSVPAPAATAPAGPESKDGRWPANTLAPGEWIQVPKVLLKRLGSLALDPRHLWFLLLLQSDRFKNRAPRYYWEELAEFCGKDKNTVRRWATELKTMGLLRIEACRTLDEGERSKPGYRNERNKFDLTPLERRVEQEQATWLLERQKRRKRK